ncbi:MAG: 50S ribosomal protein L25 [Candidatus Xenobia bacterium]
MHQVTLQAESRDKKGKQNAKRLRHKGELPGVLYGKGVEAMPISVKLRDLLKAISAGENVLVNLKLGAATHTAMISELQRESVSRQYHHVDFHKVSLEDTVETTVAIKFHGHAAGEKTGGMVDHVLWEVEVEALPLSIPEHIDVDVSALNVDDAIHVRDLKVPEGVKVLSNPDDVVVIVHAPRQEETPEAAAVTPAAAGEPEVIAKGKQEE